MRVSKIVLVRPGGPLGRLACAFGIHGCTSGGRESPDFTWCRRCGASLSPGWSWAGAVHQDGFSLVTYLASEAPT